MPLAPGTRLGPYEIVAPLGAGGMGEVYRARDSRLGRDVAIKVLPQHLSADPELRARFEREARSASSLNHPHICVLHDVGREGHTDYLVMELIEGETLADRLAKGALPPLEVVKLGEQIADALDRAHRVGVIHRDLKPGNIMLAKGGAKLMDFGLARATGAPGTPGASGPDMAAMSQSPTMTQPLTAEGTIVGTFQYMSPEQLEGNEADARSDLWALGCVLYEMVTGQRAFDGKSQASLISSIMKDEPRPMTERVPMSPPALDRLVRACLAKDPEERLQTAHDAKLQLEWIAEAGSQAGVPAPVSARRRVRERLAWGITAVSLIVAAGFAWLALESRLQEREAIRATVRPPEQVALDEYSCNVAISPDGRAIVFRGSDRAGQPSLWIRFLASEDSHNVPDANGFWPFWSPDGKSVAFFDLTNGKLARVQTDGGRPTVICDASNGRGGTWNRSGTIVFAPAPDGPLMRVTAGGGEPTAATVLDSSRHETAHRFPYFLPDGEHFLFAALPGGPNGWDICVGSLRSRTARRLMAARSAAIYAEPGYLLFERDGRVMAQRFDPGRLALTGDPVAIADAPERSDLDAEPVVSASRNGRLALLQSVPPDKRIEIVDRTGATRTAYNLPSAPWNAWGVSPDGRRAAILNGRDIWILDLARSVPMRFASSTASAPSVVWSPDGTRLAFVTKHKGREEIHIAGLDGQAEPIPTTEDPFKVVCDWSRDGRFIVFATLNAETGWDLWVLAAEGERKAVPYVRDTGSQGGGFVSPDGRWLAYQSDETGQAEVYVQSFPVPGLKTRVSPDGGVYPIWTRSGREMLYGRGSVLMAVSIEAGEDLRPGTPRRLFTWRPGMRNYDYVSFGDGERFLASFVIHETSRNIRLVLDWPALLKR